MDNNDDIYDYELHGVTDFEIVGDYTIRLTFVDGIERVINFEPILYGPMFGLLRDIDLFNKVRLETEFRTLAWPTRANIDPTVLHHRPDHLEAIIERRRRQFGVLEQH